jgi:hypothetical protein
MPRTIDEGFRVFASRLAPSATETDRAKSHRSSIEQSLTSNYSMSRFFRTGSFGNGTSISGYSDTDCFAVLPKNQHQQDSNSNLNYIRQTLANRFPLTNVVVDNPAIRLEFGNTDWEKIEVTPAYHANSYGSYAIYGIADGSGGWRQSSPEIHNDYVREIDNKLSNKVKPLIRFIKAWKFFNNVPISSFYLELWVTQYSSKETTIVYDIDLKNIFSGLSTSSLTSINDPKGISGAINPTKKYADHLVALAKIKTAQIYSDNARLAEMAKDTGKAFEWWDKIFLSKFPSYYP